MSKKNIFLFLPNLIGGYLSSLFHKPLRTIFLTGVAVYTYEETVPITVQSAVKEKVEQAGKWTAKRAVVFFCEKGKASLKKAIL